jgi:hypothetical protein
MSFTEINLFGVYVAPISLMMVAAWLVLRPVPSHCSERSSHVCQQIPVYKERRNPVKALLRACSRG